MKTDAAAYRRSYKAAFEHMVRSGDKALSAEPIWVRPVAVALMAAHPEEFGE